MDLQLEQGQRPRPGAKLDVDHGVTPGWDGTLDVLRVLEPSNPWVRQYDTATSTANPF